ncbi:MAG: LPXTG cell wall anchor domain-containing protein [Stackebrandtia sp.]
MLSLVAAPATAAAAEPDCGAAGANSLLGDSCASESESTAGSRQPEAEEGVDHLRKSADRQTYKPGDKITFTIEISASETGTGTDNFYVYDRMDDVLDDAAYNDDAQATRGTAELRQGRDLVWEGQLEPGESATLTFSVTTNAEGDGQIENLAQYAAHSEGLPCAFTRSGDSGRPSQVDFDSLAEQCKAVVVLAENRPSAGPGDDASAKPVGDTASKLPVTGSSLGSLIAVAAGLVMIGTVLLAVARKRRSRAGR